MEEYELCDKCCEGRYEFVYESNIKGMVEDMERMVLVCMSCGNTPLE